MTFAKDGSLSFTEELLINKLLEETGIDFLQPVVSPIDEATLANSTVSEPLAFDEHTMERDIVGSLIYISARTRSDLLVVTSMFGPFLYNTMKLHILAKSKALR